MGIVSVPKILLSQPKLFKHSFDDFFANERSGIFCGDRIPKGIRIGGVEIALTDSYVGRFTNNFVIELIR